MQQPTYKYRLTVVTWSSNGRSAVELKSDVVERRSNRSRIVAVTSALNSLTPKVIVADKSAYRSRDEARESITIDINNNRLSADISIQGKCGNHYGSLLGGRDINSYENTLAC